MHDQVFSRIINLDERTDRWARVKSLGVQRFSAIKPLDDKDAASFLSLRACAEFKAGRSVAEGIPTKGAVGVYRSHVAIWSEFLATDKPFCLVLEDDANVTRRQLEEQVKEMLALGFDIGLLGWTTPIKLPLVRDPLDARRIVPWPRGQCFYGAHAYMISRPVAQVLVREAFPMEMQLDFYMQAQAWKQHWAIRTSTKQIRQFQMGTNIQEVCLRCEPYWDKVLAAIAVVAMLLVLCIHLKHSN